MTPSRFKGIATSWLPNKRHSYVRVISNEDSGKLKVEFQNDKFETKTFELDPRILVSLAKKEKFMGM